MQKSESKEAYEIWYDIWAHMGSLSGQIFLLPDNKHKHRLRQKLEELSKAIQLYSQLSDE